ncbi:MAG: nucleotide-binding domain containing protein, partial [Desulfopila sp.]
EQLGTRFDGHLLIPAFFEGGRFTVNDIHYVLEGGKLIPAAETEFAKDAVFGYRNSHMPHYIEEKTAGACAASAVICISISDLREGGASRVTEILTQQHHATRIVVNAANYHDMETFVLGLLAAEQTGRRYLVRSSASYVKIRGAVKPIPYLGRDDIVEAKNQHCGGLVVVGSYVGKTSAQIEAARAIKDLKMLEVKVENLLDKTARADEISTVRQEVEKAIQIGQDVLIYTSRNLVRRDDEDENLSVGKKVSSALVEIVGKLTTQPRFLIAKGGITSSDLATDALGVKSARILGQVGPGISVWELQKEAKFPGMAYVVFPGNVGTAETLAEIIMLLRVPASA